MSNHLVVLEISKSEMQSIFEDLEAICAKIPPETAKLRLIQFFDSFTWPSEFYSVSNADRYRSDCKVHIDSYQEERLPS